MGVPKFEVVHGPTNQIQYKLIESGGTVIITSDGFPSKDSCFKAIQSIKDNVRIGQRWEMKSEENKHYFTLKAAAHNVLAKGGPYATVEDREKVVAIVRSSVEAVVVDKT